MGTRGLTGFVLDKQVRMGYQQYDSYPSGVGAVVLDFARTLEDSTDERFNATCAAVARLVVVDDQTQPTAEQIGLLADRGILEAESVSSGADWYAWLRSTQGDPQLILNSGFITDSVSFANDSLFCEYAYLIDLDTRTFEGYIGFQNEYHNLGRFARRKPANWTATYLGQEFYYPIALKVSYPLNALPTQEQFEEDMLTDEQRKERAEEEAAE